VSNELAVLDAALQFHVLPDELEAKMSAHWWQLYQVYLEEMKRA